MTGAIIASTLTTVFSFDMYSRGNHEAAVYGHRTLITFTLTASLIVALTFVPMMAAGLLKNPKEVRHAC